MEAVAIQLREVGIEIALEEADWVAAVRPKLQKREASGYLWAIPPSKKAVEPQLAVFNVGKGIAHMFQTDEIYKMWEDLLQITDAKARDAQLRKIGNYKFENFETIPCSTSSSRSSWTPRSSRTGRSPAGTGATSATPGGSRRASRRRPASSDRDRPHAARNRCPMRDAQGSQAVEKGPYAAGGARESRARRSPSTLSARPRAPTKRMGRHLSAAWLVAAAAREAEEAQEQVDEVQIQRQRARRSRRNRLVRGALASAIALSRWAS